MSVVIGVNGVSRSLNGGSALSYAIEHDPSAALIVSGKVVAAVEEERLSRRRHATGMAPARSLAEVLDIGKVRLAEVDRIAFPWMPPLMGVSPEEITQHLSSVVKESSSDVTELPPVEFVEHHRAHAWSGIAFLPPGLRQQRVAVLVLDGMGESTAGALFRLTEGSLRQCWALGLRGSLGLYYEGATRQSGFGWFEEGKTMGLAAYGAAASGVAVPPIDDDRVEGQLPQVARSLRLSSEYYTDLVAQAASRFTALSHCNTFNERADLALAAQQVLVTRIVQYVREIVDDIDVLIMAGGTALNCSANRVVADLCSNTTSPW